MKKIYSLITQLLLVLSLCVALPLVVFGTDFSQAGITLVNQNPDPANAGDVAEVTLNVQNMGSGEIKNVQIEALDQYPFTVISDATISVPSILSSSAYAQTLKFKLKIASDAKAGTYQLRLQESDSSSPVPKEYTVNIVVGSSKKIEIVGINKHSILPGETANVSFVIKNVGTSKLNNIEFSWANSNNVLLPVGSDNKYYIQTLDVGQSIEVPFIISASTTTTPDLYKLDLTMAYQDSISSQTTSQTSSAGMYVGGGTDFDIIYSDVSGSDYSFTIANTGSTDATSVQVSVDASSNWKASKSSQIVGNLNKGDYTTVTFPFVRTFGDLVFNIQYTDTFGVRETVTKQIQLDVPTNSSRVRTGTYSGSTRTNAQAGLGTGLSTLGTWVTNIFYLLVIGAIIAVVYHYYWKKKKK